jgi:hypothetical protein
MANFVLPYEANDVAHFEAEKRQEETKHWLRRHQPTVDSPPIAPDDAAPEAHFFGAKTYGK